MYGDTEVMRRRVDELREQAVDIRAEADQLVGRAEAVPWHGRAADAMRTRIKERAFGLHRVAERHEAAADSLDKHAVEVERLKEAIAEIEQRVARDEADADAEDHPPRDVPPSGHKDWLEVEVR